MASSNFTKLRELLNRGTAKSAGLPEKEDEGKSVSTGARSEENSADVKNEVPTCSVETAPANPEHGKSDDPVPESGLQQATTGKMPDVEKAVKTVVGESEKVANLDLSTDAGFSDALKALSKAAACLPTLLAQSGVKAAPTTPVAKQASADDESKAIVALYTKYGNDTGLNVSQYFKGYYGMLSFLKQAEEDGSLGQMVGQAPPGAEEAAAAGAGAGAGAMPPGADAGAGAPPAAPPGADAGAPGGAPPAPGGDAGAPGGGGGEPTPDDLAQAFMEMGVSPETVIAAAQKMQGEVAGSEASDEDKAKAAFELASIVKQAHAVRTYMRSGQFQLKSAAPGSPANKRREAAKSYLNDLLKSAE